MMNMNIYRRVALIFALTFLASPGWESLAARLDKVDEDAIQVATAGSSIREGFRDLQATENPCAVPYLDAVLPSMDLAVDNFKPSFIENCLSSKIVNKTLMYNHTSDLKATFEQYYCFYDVSKNASASDPLSYQPELGYTLFSGPLEGQVNVEQELNALLENIETEGASLATFWQIQTIFSSLFDAHVTLPTSAGLGALANLHILSVYPERNLSPSTRMALTRMEPIYLENGDLELKVIWQAADGNTTEDIVVSINEMSPYDFVLGIVSKPEAAINFPYQSIGARMNGAFKRLATSSSRGKGGEAFTLGSLSRPTSILPETFVVTYASGELETYFTGLSYRSSNTSVLYGALNDVNIDTNTPGSAYNNFIISSTQIQSTTAKNIQELSPLPKALDTQELPMKPAARSTHDTAPFVFDQVINLVTPAGQRRDVAAYKIQDDYAVLKIASFDFEADDQGNPAMTAIWSNFTAAAKAKGVTKAIIDLAGNGGGAITSGYQLAISMFPFVSFDVFVNQFDIPYNDVMLYYNGTVSPLLERLAQDISSFDDTQLQAYLDDLPSTTGDVLRTIIFSLLGFCCNDLALESCSNVQRCFPLFDLDVAAETLIGFPAAPQLRTFLEQLTAAFDEYNPFNVLGALQRGYVNPNEIVNVNRGGALTNLTNQFTIMNEELYFSTVANAFQNDFAFEEFTIVSDGTAGSTACIFSSMAMQLWNNTDGPQPKPRLTTVTYGGTKEQTDTTVAGFPASDQQVNIGYPIIAAGLLYVLQFLLPPALSGVLMITGIFDSYLSILPVPPYFAEGLPRIPVYNYYSNFMQPGAIPLQYVKIKADKHILQVFNGNSLTDTSDLAALYEEAARLGFSSDLISVEEDEGEAVVGRGVWP